MSGAGRRLWLAVAVSGLLLGGCTTTLTESHTGGDASGDQVKLDAKSARVVLMPIDIELFELTAAGLKEPKADWTGTARVHVTGALTAYLAERNLGLARYRKPPDPKAVRRDAQLEKLHATVGGTILVHHYDQMNRLPTKGGKMDWTLGSTARQLGMQQSAEFALFVFLRDSHATAGRKAAVVASSIISIIGTPRISGGERVGFASLVDLRNGKVVWFNALYSDSGDMREAKPAREVVDDILAGFPT
ncbi:MAG: hypothetical protein IMF05_13845 [Proteobacteria bacterium]|nr:hypothetical protein [Pseudomonadota bacterium]